MTALLPAMRLQHLYDWWTPLMHSCIHQSLLKAVEYPAVAKICTLAILPEVTLDASTQHNISQSAHLGCSYMCDQIYDRSLIRWLYCPLCLLLLGTRERSIGIGRGLWLVFIPVRVVFIHQAAGMLRRSTCMVSLSSWYVKLCSALQTSDLWSDCRFLILITKIFSSLCV